MADAVQVEPGASCVRTESLIPQVEAWLGSSQVDAALTVSVQGHPSDARDVTIEIQRAGKLIGQRSFRPAPFVCAQLEATLALAIAMGVRVSLRDELLGSLGDRAKRGPESSLGGMLRTGYNLLPGVSWGAGLAGARAFGNVFALRAEAFADAARDASFAHASGTFDTLLLSGQLSACALFPVGSPWGVRSCIGLALGALQARGQGYHQNHADWLAWLAVSNSLAVSLRLAERWSLDLPGSVVIPLNKLTFGAAEADGSVASVHRLPRLGFTLSLGPQYRF